MRPLPAMLELLTNAGLTNSCTVTEGTPLG